MSDFVGTPGERIKLTLTVLDTTFIDTDYGISTLVTYRDDQGNIVKWFASGEHEPEIGSTGEYEATVKRHVEFNEGRETQVTRVVPYLSPEQKAILAKLRREAKAEYERLAEAAEQAWQRVPSEYSPDPETRQRLKEYIEARNAAEQAWRAWKEL